MASESKRNPQKRRRSSIHQYVENIGQKIDLLSKGISKGLTKTKKFAIEKVVKAESTKETDEMIQALTMFNSIQDSMDPLLDGTITNLYNAKADESTHSLHLSETLMSLQTFQMELNEIHDLFKHFGEEVMGRKLFKLNTITNEYLVKMEKELINPISIYKTKELKKAQLLLTEYEAIKTDYDFAVHRYNKLIQTKDNKTGNMNKKKEDKIAIKISQSDTKKKDKLVQLQTKRVNVMQCIHNLHQKQQVDLVNCFDKFWKSYCIFAEQQSQTMSLKDLRDEEYEAQKQSIMHPETQKTDDTDIKQSDDDFEDEFEDEQARKSSSNSCLSSNSLIPITPKHNLQRSTSLRVAVINNDNQPLSKELRYKNPTKLGSGAFATVYKATDLLDDDREVAIKKICIRDDENVLYLSSTKNEAENELRIMKLLDGHSNIIHLVDDYYEETVYNDFYLNLVMDYVPFTLLSRLEFYGETGDSIPFDLIQIYSFQLIKAVNYMHIHKIAHRDIKPDNLLVNVQTHVLILCDFGCSIEMKYRYNDDEDDDDEEDVDKDTLQSYVCSRYYRAPELILQSADYDCKIDIWSIGCVIAEMFLGTLLFEGDNDENEQLDDIIHKLGTPNEDDIDEMNENYANKEEILDRDEMGESWEMLFIAVIDMPQVALQLISKIVKYSPSKRWTALQCLNAKYFDGLTQNDEFKQWLFDWTKLEIEYAKEKGIALFNM